MAGHLMLMVCVKTPHQSRANKIHSEEQSDGEYQCVLSFYNGQYHVYRGLDEMVTLDKNWMKIGATAYAVSALETVLQCAGRRDDHFVRAPRRVLEVTDVSIRSVWTRRATTADFDYINRTKGFQDRDWKGVIYVRSYLVDLSNLRHGIYRLDIGDIMKTSLLKHADALLNIYAIVRHDVALFGCPPPRCRFVNVSREFLISTLYDWEAQTTFEHWLFDGHRFKVVATARPDSLTVRGQFCVRGFTPEQVELRFQQAFKTTDLRSPDTPTSNHLKIADYVIEFLVCRPIKEIGKELLDAMQFKDAYCVDGFRDQFKFVASFVIDLTRLEPIRDYNLNTSELIELVRGKETFIYVFVIRDKTVGVFGKLLPCLRAVSISQQVLDDVLRQDVDPEPITFDAYWMAKYKQEATAEVRALPGQQMAHLVNASYGELAVRISELDARKTIEINVADALVEFRDKNFNITESDYVGEMRFLEESVICLSFGHRRDRELNTITPVSLNCKNFTPLCHTGDTFRFLYVIVSSEESLKFAFTQSDLQNESRLLVMLVNVDAFDVIWTGLEKRNNAMLKLLSKSRWYKNEKIRHLQLPLRLIRASSKVFYGVVDVSNMYYVEDSLFEDNVLEEFESSKEDLKVRLFLTGSAVDGKMFRINNLSKNLKFEIVEVNVELAAPQLRGFSFGHGLRVYSTVIHDPRSGFAVRAARVQVYSNSSKKDRTGKRDWTAEVNKGKSGRQLDTISKWIEKTRHAIETCRHGAIPLTLGRLGTVHDEFFDILYKLGDCDDHKKSVRLQFESFFGQFGDFVTLATEVLRTRAKLDSSLVDARLQLDKLLVIHVLDENLMVKDIGPIRQQFENIELN